MKNIILSAMVLTMITCQLGHSDPAPSSDTAQATVKGERKGRKCPGEKITLDGHDILEVLTLLGAKREAGTTDRVLIEYTKHFAWLWCIDFEWPRLLASV